ncbi:Hydroxyneurosporene synthase (CrtC) [Mycolicibacterium rutilum]|uniref:Hydroxyneurosporene synthase (CrtC) n=1 Tax=Mycolicibacterium rutilum TaxID=370526 RepID=A0A1H6L1E0_MYCRU|nr:lipocalin-like domain-containing protein [Mycolicibacterium rutilum]SEH79156.1 Hydroxyneurosporene synthase (CrtC) [Mycolicibacterium rutilum]
MGDDWRRYPYALVPGDPQLDFPAAEAEHPDCQSDTWFLAGELVADTGRGYAFLSIVNKNRPAESIVADFYTLALFDLTDGRYATYTDYDMPPANMRPGAEPKLTLAQGHLELSYACPAGTATWQTSRDDRGELVPYTYGVDFVGCDPATGDAMRVALHVTPTRGPVPLGAAAHNGRIECFGQPDTYSYFQTGMTMTGTLTWGGVTEHVSGSAGHVDRQWFPLVANAGGPGGDVRWRAHEWRTINLDNGVDLSIWHQFDRTDHNAPQPFSGVTVSHPDAPPEYAGDVEVTVDSYVRWPETVRTLVRPPRAARYLPDRHHLSSPTLGLELTGEPVVRAPAHALPLEYMEGPYRYHGTWRGQEISGFGFYERSLALWRDWELVDVLGSVLGAAAIAPLRELVESGQTTHAVAHIDRELRPLATSAAAPILDDLVAALALPQ